MAKHSKTHTIASFPNEWSNGQCIAIIAGLVAFFFRNHLLGNAFLWEDFLYFSVPAANFASTSIANGEFPLWNPYNFGGMPFFADIQTTVLYLPVTALVFFVKDGQVSYYWLQLVVILHFFIAGVSMFYFTKSLGVRNLAALLAGISYTFSSFMVLHAIHTIIVMMIAWWPLILLLFRKALHERSWFWVFPTAFFLSLSIYAGFPQLILFFHFFLFLFFVYEVATSFAGKELVSRHALTMFGKAAAVVLLAVALAAIQLLPTIELSTVSQRAAISFEKANEGQLSWGHLLTLIFPKLFGEARANDYQYWGPGVYWYYWETCIYRGAIPLLLAVMSLFLWKKNKLIPFFACFSVFAVLFGEGSNFFLQKFFYDYIPGFSKFRCPGRMAVFMSMGVSVLAAFTVNHLLSQDGSKLQQHWKRTLIIMLAIVGALWLSIISGSLSGIFDFMTDPTLFEKIKTEVNVSALMFLLSGTLLYVTVTGKYSGRWIGIALVGLLYLDLLVFGGTQNNSTVNPSSYFKSGENVTQFLKRESEKEFFRTNTRNEYGLLLDRNQAMMNRFFSLEGYSPLALERIFAPFEDKNKTYDLLNVKYQTVLTDDKRSLTLQRRDTYMPRSFFVYDYRVARNEADLKTILNESSFDYRTTAVLEKEPGNILRRPEAQPRWTSTITGYKQNSLVLDVETSADGLLVLSEVYFSGWKAYVDNIETEIFRTDYNLRGLFVNKGKHTVEFRFAPESFFLGRNITLGALMICVFGIGMGIFKKRRSPSPSA